jgi:hypothetical protein
VGFGISLLDRSSEPLDKEGTGLFEARAIVLDKTDEGEAWKKANEHGLSMAPLLEERDTNVEGRWVVWTFERSVEVKR